MAATMMGAPMAHIQQQLRQAPQNPPPAAQPPIHPQPAPYAQQPAINPQPAPYAQQPVHPQPAPYAQQRPPTDPGSPQRMRPPTDPGSAPHMRPPTSDSALAVAPPKNNKVQLIFFAVLAAVVIAAVVIALASCGHAPPPPPKPAEKPVAAASDIAGKWVASDDTDFAYALTITAEGAFDLWIDRNKMGRCEEKGTLAAASDKTFNLTYKVNDCHRETVGQTQPLAVESFTGDALTIALAGGRQVYRRAQ
jgi:hypothetical protein